MNIEKDVYNRKSLVLFIPLLLGMLTVFSISPVNFTLIKVIILLGFLLLVCHINNKSENFYGGGIWSKEPYSNYYKSPNLKGTLYKSRRRFTEIEAKNKIHSPSTTLNGVGPGEVGTGALAGMRVLNFIKNKINIWPFNNSIFQKKSVAVEIFPTYYFRYARVKPEKNIGFTLDKINQSLSHYGCNYLPKDITIGGPDQDDADAIVSAAAMRYFSNNRNCWNVPKVSKKEGWIFGV